MAVPESEPPSRPAPGADARDLSDAEFDELDALLAGIPEPLEPLDPFMLDGFLAALVVQPQLIEPARWLPHVFDAEGHRWGEAEPSAEQRRASELVLRRYKVLNRMLAEFGGFDPWIPRAEAPADPAADDPAAEEATADEPASDGAATDAPAEPSPAALLSAALLPWAAGFDSAMRLFPGLDELDDAEVDAALDVIYQHLPEEEAPADGGLDAGVGAARGIADLDAAVGELVEAVAELYDRTTPMRYRVEVQRRDTPKVGRNEPCPCGSGRKFKHCHGAG